MSRLKVFITMSVLCLSLISCVILPDDYQNEIDDAVRFHVSAADFLAHHKNTEASKIFIEEIIVEQGHSISHFQKQNSNIQESITNALNGNLYTQKESFKQLLEEKAQANNSFAKEILSIYETKEISLSEFSTLSDKPGSLIGEFTETRSSIRFKFVWKSTSLNDIWLIEPNKGDFKSYLSKIQRSAKPKITTKRSSKWNETIEECVANAYSGKFSDKDIMTPEFYKNFHNALKYSELDDWAQYGYWHFEDGTTHTIQIIKHEQTDSKNAKVHIKLDSDREIKSTEIVLFVKQIENSWRVDDICGIKDSEIIYSIWDFATVLVAESESDHEGNC